MATADTPVLRDFFISYTAADLNWARWFDRVVEEAGYTAYFQERDFQGNFIDQMRDAMVNSRRTIGVMSQAALLSKYVQQEWNASLNDGARTGEDKLLLFRVGDCRPDPWLAQLAYVDLIGLNDEPAALASVLAR